MNNFLDIKLPDKIAMKAKIKLNFNTNISQSISNFEIRKQNWDNVQLIYELSSRYLSKEEINIIKNLFLNTKGCYFSFRFHDFNDYEGNFEQCLFINENTFQLIKNYNINNYQYYQKITKPYKIEELILNNNIYTKFSVDYSTGIIKTEDKINKNDILLANFKFDREVRFLSDELSFSYLNSSMNIENIVLISL